MIYRHAPVRVYVCHPVRLYINYAETYNRQCDPRPSATVQLFFVSKLSCTTRLNDMFVHLH